MSSSLGSTFESQCAGTVTVRASHRQLGTDLILGRVQLAQDSTGSTRHIAVISLFSALGFRPELVPADLAPVTSLVRTSSSSPSSTVDDR